MCESMNLVEEESCWTEKGVLGMVARGEQTTQLTGARFRCLDSNSSRHHLLFL
jgi:hypothetical protein